LLGTVILHACAGAEFMTPSEDTARRIASLGLSGSLLFLAIFIFSGAFILPPAIMTIAAGVIWPFDTAFGIGLAGCMATAALGFYMSRYVARDLCSRFIPSRLEAYDERLRKHGLQTTIILRLLFFLFPPVSWMLGISKLRGRDYLAGTFIGILPGVALYTYVGSGLIPWLLADPLPRIPAVALSLSGAVGGAMVTGRLLKARRGPNDLGPALSVELMARSVLHYLNSTVRTFWPPKPHTRPPSLKRCLVMLVFIPAFALLEGAHWIALWLDELLYPSYRGIALRSPVFITGVPRSGTTLLHRVMAEDDRMFTTPRLWEMLFAPAICQKKAIGLAARADRLAGRPAAKAFSRLERLVAHGLDDIHALSLKQPEEDFLLLLPVLSCYLLVAPFPHDKAISDLGFFDENLPEDKKRMVMRFYRGMLQRHMYHHGPELTFLSKNASFAPMIRSLMAEFPDARIVVCIRSPHSTVPSQISAMKGAWTLFGNPVDSELFRERWVKLLEYYYKHLDETLASGNGQNIRCVEMSALTSRLDQVVSDLYARFGLHPAEAYRSRLAELARASRTYRSRHVYSLSDYGLDETAINARFQAHWSALRDYAGYPEGEEKREHTPTPTQSDETSR